MKLPPFVPKPGDIAKETLIVLGGALIAALIVGQSPRLRAWIKSQWGEAAAPGQLS